MKSLALVLVLLPLTAAATTITVNSLRDNTIAGNAAPDFAVPPRLGRTYEWL